MKISTFSMVLLSLFGAIQANEQGLHPAGTGYELSKNYPVVGASDDVCQAEQLLDFPSADSTIVETRGYFHSVDQGHSIQKTFSLPEASAVGAELTFCIGNSFIADGPFINWQLSINGVDVGSEFTVTEDFMSNTCKTIDYNFEAIEALEFDLKVRVTNPELTGWITTHTVNYDASSIKLIFDCGNGGAMNDPHFELFSGRWYDFMGACDLTLLHAPHFAGNVALDIDIRTKTRYGYSYIETAAIKIGDDTLEVSSWGSYAVNGVNSPSLKDAAVTVGGFPIHHKQSQKTTHVFTILLNADTKESIEVKTFKDMVSVLVHHADHTRFEGCLGMMGDLTGNMLGRDGATIIEDPNEFAAEWQVRDTEPMLFQTKSGPQYPEACQLPNVSLQQTRLLEKSSISQEDAEKACAHWDASIRAGCIHDVIATRDVGLASAL